MSMDFLCSLKRIIQASLVWRFGENESDVFSNLVCPTFSEQTPQLSSHRYAHSSLYHSPQGKFWSFEGCKETSLRNCCRVTKETRGDRMCAFPFEAGLNPFSERNLCIILLHPHIPGYSVYPLMWGSFTQSDYWHIPLLKVRPWNKIKTLERTIIVVPVVWFLQLQL